MKARIVTESNMNGSGILLTIGMIVKNEEKTLEQCLQGLQPLRDAIPCELIITDTGSVDRTIEIAQAYADKLLHFTWCNDFAKARNTAVKEAQGEWFLFVDADEIFDETISHLIEFFKSGLYKQYNSAMYTIRNYNNFQHTDYGDFLAARLEKRTPSFQFHGKIHEHIPMIPPIYHITKTIAHHDGYITYHVGNLKREKVKRNRPLLEEELKKRPDARLYRHYAETFQIDVFEETETAIEMFKKGIELGEKNVNELYGGSLIPELAECYKTMGELYPMKELIEHWFSRDLPEMMANCELYFYMGELHYANMQPEKSIQNFKEFLRLYEMHDAGQKIEGDDVNTETNATAIGAAKAKAAIAVAYARLKNFEQAKKYMEQAEPGNSLEKNKKPNLLGLFSEYLKITEDTEMLKKVYRQLWEREHTDTQQLIKEIRNSFYAPCKAQKKLLETLAACGEETDPSVQLAKLLTDPKADTKKAVFTILADEEAIKESSFAEILYYSLEDSALMERIFETVDQRYVQIYAGLCRKKHIDFSRKAFDFIKEYQPDSMKAAEWCLAIMEICIFYGNDYSQEEWMAMLEEYARRGSSYCQKLYAKEIWTEENIGLLPVKYRSVFYLNCALQAKHQKKDAEYLKYLKKGLHDNDNMKNTGEYLLMLQRKEMEEEEQKGKKEQDEMQQIKVKVKENITFLIKQDKKAEAAQLFRQYKLLAPEDADNEKIEALLLK